MAEYRPVPEERTDEFRRIASYAFLAHEGPPDLDEEPPPPARMGEPRGLFEGDELVSICKHLDFDASVRGTTLPVGGLTVVATPPEHRRRGHVRRLVAESLAEYRDRNRPLSVLWPFSRPFYGAFGYATATTHAVHECEPDALGFARVDGRGELVRLDADDWARADRAYAIHGADYGLTVDRTEEWWRKRVFSGWEDDPYVYGVESDGEIRGYVVYGVESGDDGRRLSVRELAAADHDARLELLGFLADHDSQASTVRLYGPAETSLLDLVDDPEAVETTIEAGAMARIVDVVAALEALAPPVGGDLVLGVDDPLAGWNDGTFRVALGEGTTVERTDAAPEATAGIGALTQLVVGYRSVDSLARAGELAIERPDARELLAAAFPPRDVFLRDVF